ncbi:MAG: pilus assembly protein [Desulfovibrionaceae bacterium]|nr:pilus assembly protein [Desulfovibrionaceae bacterium]MBF0512878.1 pilus assembly protein [Desulfovibrionaceae bacterium]
MQGRIRTSAGRTGKGRPGLFPVSLAGGQDGSSAVETAVVLPLLLLLIFGVIEVGNAMSTWLMIQNAADTGARYAATGQGVIGGTQMTGIVNSVNQILVASRGQAGVVTVRSWAGTNPAGAGRLNNPGLACDTVEIQVGYTYNTITPIASMMGLFGSNGWGAQIPMNAYARRVNEPWQPCP